MVETTTAFAVAPDGSPGRKILIADDRKGHLEARNPETGLLLAAAQILRQGKYVTGWAVASAIEQNPMCVDNKKQAYLLLRKLAGKHRASA